MEIKYPGFWGSPLSYFFISLLFVLVLSLQKKKLKHLRPPGPARFPILGNLPNFLLHRKYPDIPNVLVNFAEKWGSIMSVKISGSDTVIFSDHETAFAILNHEKAQNKAVTTIMMERLGCKNIGINFSNGHNWQMMRTFTVSCLKTNGLNNFSKEIFAEVCCLTTHWDLNYLNNKSGNVLNSKLFGGAVFNIIWKLVSGGDRFEYDDERLKLVLHSTEEFTRSINLVLDPLASISCIRRYFPKIFVENKWLKNIGKFCMEELTKRKLKMRNDNEPASFLDTFARKILENGDSTSPIFTDEQFVITLMDLFQNAVDTVSSALVYLMISSILYPTAKEKALQEIDEFMGEDISNRAFTATQFKLPYTFAFVLETLRFSSSIPIVAPRVATGEIRIGGYYIEAGTSLLVNLLALNNSQRVWGDPENFRPDRFLSSCGKLDSSKARLVMSFGSGRRVCPSQKLSERMLLIFAVEILRKYEFISETRPVSGPNFAVSYSPTPFWVRIQNRVATK